jgi:uncharacterized transporter YbjL
MDIVLGIIGAIVGGFLFNLPVGAGATGFNLYSMIVAVIGAVVVLWIFSRRRGPPTDLGFGKLRGALLSPAAADAARQSAQLGAALTAGSR